MKIKEKNLKIIVLSVIGACLIFALYIGLTQSHSDIETSLTTTEDVTIELPTENYVVSCIKYHRSDVPEFSDGFISGYYIPSDLKIILKQNISMNYLMYLFHR